MIKCVTDRYVHCLCVNACHLSWRTRFLWKTRCYIEPVWPVASVSVSLPLFFSRACRLVAVMHVCYERQTKIVSKTLSRVSFLLMASTSLCLRSESLLLADQVSCSRTDVSRSFTWREVCHDGKLLMETLWVNVQGLYVKTELLLSAKRWRTCVPCLIMPNPLHIPALLWSLSSAFLS